MASINNYTRKLLAVALAAFCTFAGSLNARANTNKTGQSRDLPITSNDCQTQKFALFEGPDIGDITGIDNGCADVINAIRTAIQNNQNPLTSRHLYYLSELAPYLGANYSKLPCFLKAVKGTEFGAATLVIDEPVTLSEPLVIPSRYTLAGTGIDGEGSLRFTGLADGVAAIRFDNQATNITIRDISIGRLDGGVNVGIDVSRANKVFIRDVLVTGFFAGIYGSRPGTSAISVYIDRASVFGNDYNIVMHQNAFHWRVRDCILSQARCVGLRIFGSQDDPVPPANGQSAWGNDYLISGCRFESCGSIGALIGSDSAILTANRFEQNGGVGGVGIRILATASHTRLISNYLASNTISLQPGATDTQSWGNILVG
ncbi:MAG TPA: hypothetical protein VID27_08850 [Blastocatellia bacterium]|jgi:hypothetical protein